MNILTSSWVVGVFCILFGPAPSESQVMCLNCTNYANQMLNEDEWKCLQPDLYSPGEIPAISCDGICYAKRSNIGGTIGIGIERGCHTLDENNPNDKCIHQYGCYGSNNTSCLYCCADDMCNEDDPAVVISQWNTCFSCVMSADGDPCTEEGFNPYDRAVMRYNPCPGDCDTISVPAILNLGLNNPSFIRSCTVPYLVDNVVCDPSTTTEGGETVCTETNYGRKNPKGETCCCKGELCNGPFAPTWAPTTISPSTTKQLDSTENKIDETRLMATMESLDPDLHDMSTEFPDLSTEEISGAAGLTLKLVVYLQASTFLCYILW